MSKATYWQRGESLDYLNEGTEIIEANSIVALGERIGVAGTDINPGETGSLIVYGAFCMPKAAAAISAGAALYWDPEKEVVTATKGSLTVEAGYAINAATAADEMVYVKLAG